jgi:predicted lysophospholipase L1 biosynthesis ABC-type transport system permease subunit
MRRESRGSRGRLVFFAACLAVGVAAVVAVAGLSAGLDAGIRDQARPLLASDLAVEGRRSPPPELDRALAGLPVARRTEVRELVTVVAAPRPGGDPAAAPPPSLLVEL